MAKQKFTEKYKELWTFIKFTLAGFAATLIEMVVHVILDSKILSSMNYEPFKWMKIANTYIFNYKGDGIEGKGTMIAFFISTIIGYTIAYIINRKVTFNADNNAVVSTIIYAIMVFFIVCFQSWGGPIVKGWLYGYIPTDSIASLGSKVIMCTLCTAISYPMNRFVIQRQKKS